MSILVYQDEDGKFAYVVVNGAQVEVEYEPWMDDIIKGEIGGKDSDENVPLRPNRQDWRNDDRWQEQSIDRQDYNAIRRKEDE